MRKLLLGVLCCTCFAHVAAQTEQPAGQEYVYKQKAAPLGIDNYLFSTYYYNEKNTYNLRGARQSSSSGEVIDLKINPSGSSFAVLSVKGKGASVSSMLKGKVTAFAGLLGSKKKGEPAPVNQQKVEGGETAVAIYDLWTANRLLYELKEVERPTAICYSPDAKRMVIATAGGQLLFFDTRKYQLQDKIELPFTATKLAMSSNNYFLAAANGEKVIIWNIENKSVRKELLLENPVNGFAFSNDCSTFALLTAGGLLSTYDTKTFFIQQSLDAMGVARNCHFHPDGKYLAIVTGDTRISIINLLDEQDRTYIDNPMGGILDVRFVKDGKKRTFVAYNTTNAIHYKQMNILPPFYAKLMGDELNERMNDWLKMMPGETLDEYNLRVNDDTRAKQMLLFEQEIATRMADNLLTRSEVSLGNYNPESGMLAVDFNTMPSIYLDVPKDEIDDFMNPGNLEFRNATYGLTKNDKFELVYADVYNKVSGKTYIFDNRDRQSLDYLQSSDSFVPMELVRQSNMEELKLQEIKENIVELAKKKNTISDHTKISVDARVVPDVDANGEKIMNYKVGFAYQVEKKFSVLEDFAPGKYKVEQSGAAMSMLSIVKTAFESEFAQYCKEGKKVIVKITGMADALPINGKISYDGSYGDFINEPIYKNNDLSNITVTQASGITENEQLAFLRAEGVREYISHRIPAFKSMNTDYRQYIEVTEGKGGEFRRINVEFTFIDAF